MSSRDRIRSPERSRPGRAGRSDLEVPMAELRARRGPRRAWSVVTTLDGLSVGDTEVPADEPVAVEVVLESLPHGVAASGTVTTRWSGACHRCLETVGEAVEVELKELFSETPVEGESYPLGTETIDLEPMVRDAVLLDLPVIARCPWATEDPCPLSGYSRAEQEGAAREDEGDDTGAGRSLGDPRWAALDALREDR